MSTPERPVSQTHMGTGWDMFEREEARQEPALARPQWECVGNGPRSQWASRRCGDCLVLWRGELASACWMCGQPSIASGTTGYGSERHSTVGRYDYEPMRVPAGGCGCNDETVPLVAERAAVIGVWKACEEMYGEGIEGIA